MYITCLQKFRKNKSVFVLIQKTTHPSSPRVLESVYRERGRESSAGFVRLIRYVIHDVISRSFMVWYYIYNSQYPELANFMHIPPLRISLQKSLYWGIYDASIHKQHLIHEFWPSPTQNKVHNVMEKAKIYKVF